MEIQYGDILLNANFEIFGTNNGDLATGNNKEHQIGAIINADEGNFRRTPTLAARLSKNVEGVADSREVSASITESTRLDGWRVDAMNIETSADDLKITVEDAVKTTDDTESLI